MPDRWRLRCQQLVLIAALTVAAVPSPAAVVGQWDPEFHAELRPRFAQVFNLFQYQGDLILGGTFEAVGSVSSKGIIRWNGSEWISMGQGAELLDPGPGSSAWVETMAEYNGRLIVAGRFDHMDGQPVRGIAAWDGANWSPLAGGTDGRVLSLQVHKGNLIAAGFFAFMDGIFMEGGIAKWNGDVWKPLGSLGDLGDLGAILALGEFQNKLIIGGPFTQVDGSLMNRIAEWDGDTWAPLRGGLTGQSGIIGVETLGQFENDLFVGGHFSQAGLIPATALARFGADRLWHAVPGQITGPDAVVAVLDMEVYRDHLFVGGSFTAIDGDQYGRIAQFDGAEWTPMGRGLDDWVRSLEVYQDALYVAGDFARVDDGPLTSALGRWIPQPVPVFLSFLEASRGERGDVAVRWRIRGADGAFHVHRQEPHDRAPMERLTQQVLRGDRDFVFIDRQAPFVAVDYWVEEVTSDGSILHGPIRIAGKKPGLVLHAVAPNPVGERSLFSYITPRAAAVRLTVHDVRGRRVRTLIDAMEAPGLHTTSWDGADDWGRPVSVGSYVARLEVDGALRTTKLAVTR